MIKIILIFFLCFCSKIYCQNKKYVNLNFSVEYNESNKYTVSKITYKLQEFINTKNKRLWNKDTFFPNPDGDFLNCFSLNDTTFEPTILSVKDIADDKYIVKVGFFNYENGHHYLNCIYNLLAVFEGDEIRFSNIRKFNMSGFESCQIGEISFFYGENTKFDEKEANKFSKINKRISEFFSTEKLDFKYIKCNNIYDCKKLVGYDFDLNMNDNNQNGAFTYSSYKIIFSGNNSFINTHELLHLYVRKKFGKTNMILNEGLATYFGGSKGFTLDYHLNILKQHIEENDINIYNLLFYDNYVLDKNTSLTYTIGGLLCKIILDEHGKETLFDVFNTCKNNDELMIKLEEIFKIDKSQFDNFIKKHL